MTAFLIDEDMPRSMAAYLRDVGFEATDVRDAGLQGHSDARVFTFAQEHQLTLVTADLGFSNTLDFPLGMHAGIIVMRVPNEIPTAKVNSLLVAALEELHDEHLSGLLVIVEIGRTRIRRPYLS